MKGYVVDIEKKTLNNGHFREVLYTGQHCQLVVMSLSPQEEIGVETHEIVDQFIRVEQGEGKAVINGEECVLFNGIALVIPAETEHNIINTSLTEPLKLYTLYCPPHHRKGTVHATKHDAEMDVEDSI